MLKFSSARIDENGNISGGKLGDQTGYEVSICNGYTHSLGWRVFRAKSDYLKKWIAENARVFASNNCFGYDQNNRDTAYRLCKNAGWEPANVRTNCACDCSSMVRTCIACAMEQDIPNFNTASEASVLLSLGFEEVPFDINKLEVADILVTKTKGHTEIVVEAPEVKQVEKTYTVVAGDTLTKIAREHGTTIGVLKALNGIQNANLIYIGQVIKLP